jgi:hypothetical protein
MRTGPVGFHDSAVKKAFEDAVTGHGREGALFSFLQKHSGLPGARANLRLAESFADECALKGPAVDTLIVGMLTVHADAAPGATEFEFIPVCAALAVAKRGAKDKSFRPRAFTLLKDAADDLRFRVRDAVSQALTILGTAHPDETIRALSDWTDGYLYAANLMESLKCAPFLDAIKDADTAIANLDACFQLALKAPRSAERYPGYKSMIDCLAVVPGLLAVRFGAPMFDVMESWCKAKEPMLRNAILASLKSDRIRSRFADDVRRIEAAIKSSEPKPRDPTQIVQGMRRRGKKGDR